MLFFFFFIYQCAGFPNASSRKESTCHLADTGDLGSIPGWGRSPGEGNGSPLQYSCLENPMDGGAWRDTQSTGLQRLGHDCPWLYHHSLYTILLVCVLVFSCSTITTMHLENISVFPKRSTSPCVWSVLTPLHCPATANLLPASLDLPVLDF